MSSKLPGGPHMPQLDGLRTLAVAAVAWSHWMGPYQFGFEWGLMGVNLFFVLSGFLITGILLDSRAGAAGPAGRWFAIRQFYTRRVLRIFPLFYMTLALLALVGADRCTDCVGEYSVAGYVFSDALRAITRGLRSAGFAAEVVFAIGLAAYIVYRIWVYRKYRLLDVIPRIPAEELAKRLASEAAQNMLIADVRSHGYYDADSERIAGSIRIEPNNLVEEVKNLPKDQEIYLYCT